MATVSWPHILCRHFTLYITLATTQDGTLIDHALQNGGLFPFFARINCPEYYNKGFGSKLTRKLLYYECIAKSNKKLSYRRGTARFVVSIEILPIATQQCRNYLYDKS